MNIFALCYCEAPGSTGDFLLLLRLEDDRTYYGMMQNFNPPEREYMVQEYMKCLL